MDFRLDDGQRQQLRHLQKQLVGKGAYVRVTVLLMLDLGHSLDLIQQSLGLDHTTIYRYVSHYRQGGSQALLANHYVGYWGGLNSQQLSHLQAQLRQNLFTSSREVCQWIKASFGVHYHPQGLVKLLHRLGFAYKKTHLVPGQANLDGQAAFVADFQTLMAGLTAEQVVYFTDAVHLGHATRSGYAWMEVGQQRALPSNPYQPCLHLNGAIQAGQPTTSSVIVPVTKVIDAQAVIAFYEQIQAQQADKSTIYLICDRARVHTAKAVQQWLKTSRIQEVLLPAYWPNLNIIERLWKWTRKKVIDFCYYPHFSFFREAVLDLLAHLPDHRAELNTLLSLRFGAP